MRNTRYHAVIFDFDGTLAELTIDFAAMKRALLREARIVVPDAPDPGDTPALEWMRALAADLEARDPAGARALDARLHAVVRTVETRAARQGRLFPFTRPLLDSLASQGLRTGIITRNCSDALYAVFPDAREHARVILTRDDVPRTKPDPAHIRAALETLNANPAHTLMVGDHTLDIETGRRANIDAAGVLTGNCTRQALQAAGGIPQYGPTRSVGLRRLVRR